MAWFSTTNTIFCSNYNKRKNIKRHRVSTCIIIMPFVAMLYVVTVITKHKFRKRLNEEDHYFYIQRLLGIHGNFVNIYLYLFDTKPHTLIATEM